MCIRVSCYRMWFLLFPANSIWITIHSICRAISTKFCHFQLAWGSFLSPFLLFIKFLRVIGHGECEGHLFIEKHFVTIMKLSKSTFNCGVDSNWCFSSSRKDSDYHYVQYILYSQTDLNLNCAQIAQKSFLHLSTLHFIWFESYIVKS